MRKRYMRVNADNLVTDRIDGKGWESVLRSKAHTKEDSLNCLHDAYRTNSTSQARDALYTLMFVSTKMVQAVHFHFTFSTTLQYPVSFSRDTLWLCGELWTVDYYHLHSCALFCDLYGR
jgi:hypothetical protein